MLKSMTGYGVAEGTLSGMLVRVEIRSLNSRYFDFSARLPSFLSPLESEIKTAVKKAIKRGKVTLSITTNGQSSFPASFSIDQKKVAFYIRELKKVGKKEGLQGTLELKDLLSFPEIFVAQQRSFSLPSVRRQVVPIVWNALENINTMRQKEGANIVKDIKTRHKKIISLTRAIEKKARKEPPRVRTLLEERLNKHTRKITLDPSRLEQEVAYLVDKSDVTEEITRLISHCDLFAGIIAGSGEAGKRLEFITQELNREANTIGSKTQSAAISQDVIAIKLEVEKIREQIQNIE